MKKLVLRVFIAILAFITGVSFAGVWYWGWNFGFERSGLPQKRQQSEADQSPWRLLLSFENQALLELEQPARNELLKAVAILVKKDIRPFASGFEPTRWPFGSSFEPTRFSKISGSHGELSYILIEQSGTITGPTNYVIRSNVFSLDGRLRSSSVFSPGRRTKPTEIRVTYVPQIGREAVVISTRSTETGSDEGKQYYALIGQELVLARREDSSGMLVRNGYDIPAVGPESVKRSAEEWEKEVVSADTAEVLAALTWLSGKPLNVPHPPDEDMTETRLADAVRSRDSVKAALNRLLQSENSWLREAAELVMK